MTTEKSGIDVVSISLADQITGQALSLSSILAKLYLNERPIDGVTTLQSALRLVPELEGASGSLDTYEIAVGKTGAIGSTYLTNEQALAACYALRSNLVSLRPLGAEIIQKALSARSAIDETMRQILLIDWSDVSWNSQLMAIVGRYRSLVLSISRSSDVFSDADEGTRHDKYKKLIVDSLIPNCHKIAAQLVRSNLPVIAAAKEAVLDGASDSLLEFDRLWTEAAMPLFKFALLTSFQSLPSKTRELLLSKDDIADIRNDLPAIFASYSAGIKAPLSKAEFMGSLDEGRHYAPDNFRMVPEFADLIDYLKGASDFAGLDTLVMLNYAEMCMNISLLKMDLVELGLELGDKQFAQPLSSFLSALIYSASKLNYSNAQLINEVRGTQPESEASDS